MFQHRTDLAIEAGEIYREQNKNITEIDGVISKEDIFESFTLTKIRITNENGEKALGKKQGNYITFQSPALLKTDPDASATLSSAIKKELSAILGNTENKSYLVCGLGNKNITPDSIGPDVAAKILVTRHLKNMDPSDIWKSFSSVSAFAPGVLGITGIETVEIIKGICEKTKPDTVIVVDALAARKTARICTSIQITDTGITPGSGVGNHRKAINEETLGVPVIAIGVPMVIDIGTIALDILSETDEKSKKDILYRILSENNMIVTPKDIDILTRKMAYIISSGINYTLHPDLSEEDITSLSDSI